MKIAVTYKDSLIFQHFGHCQDFKIYSIDNDKISTSEVISTNGANRGELATFLKQQGVDTLICGGVGDGAKSALAKSDITIYPGVTGAPDEAVEAFLSGNLIYNPNVVCNDSHKDHKKHK